MAGNGPAPKDPNRRQRRNKDTVPERVEFTMNGEEVVLVQRPIEEPIAN